jgi:membrane protease YdiL (CAAX protease family)
VSRANRATGNPFGIAEALVGLAGGFALSLFGVSAYDAARHLPTSSVTIGATVVSLFGLWIGLVGACVLAVRASPRREAAPRDEGEAADHSLRADFGLRLKPWPDLPLGLAVGVVSQFALVPLLELPLEPFVPHLEQRLGHPARQLLGPASSSGTASFVLLAVLICVGSPIVEELFFRGLVLRSLLGRFGSLGAGRSAALSIVATGLLFGLVHFEALQFLGLAGFGMILGLLAWRTGRLGASITAHLAFNASTVIAYALVR